MSVATVETDLDCFPEAYFDKADQVFLRPNPRHTWDEIVPKAVAQNTFRGFHRINKNCIGAKEGFVKYFLEQQQELVGVLSSIRTRGELHVLSNRICEQIRVRLSNCLPAQLRAYNKIRKPVDLYIEHLVAMAVELDEVRHLFVPLLFLPLDSQIIVHQALFTEQERSAHGLTLRSTYRDITSEQTYLSLAELLEQKSDALSAKRDRAFHVIYFDLL